MATQTPLIQRPGARRSVQALVGAYVGAWIGAGLIALVGAHGPIVVLISLAATVLGGVAGWAGSRDAEPWAAQDIRDGALGWGLVAAIVVAVPCALLPLPWSAIAAACGIAVVAIVVAAVRRAVQVS